MFSFSHVYPASVYKEGRKPRNVRTRILGVRHPDKVLYLLMTSNSTEILLVEMNGKSTTVLSFNRYVEIICADISSDDNLLIYTERIPNGTKFSFRSNMYILSSLSDIKAFEDNSPITSFFLPDFSDNENSITQGNEKKEYLFLNIIGNSITHFRATFVNKKLQIKHERMGVNLSNCRSFFYDSNSKNNRLICAITRNNTAYFFDFGQNRYFYKTDFKLTSYETINFCKYDIINLSRIENANKSSGGFNIFNFSKDKNKGKNEDSINLPTTITPEGAIKLMSKYTMLPPELALLPSVPSNNPFFRFSTGNMYVIRLLPLSISPNFLSSYNSESIEAVNSSSPTSPFCKDFAIIEQLYRGEEFPLAFSVTVVEKNYSRLIEVPNVQPDVPLNFLSYDNIVFIFVLNSFISMIDFASFPPSIFFLPRSLCQGPQIEPNGNPTCDISTTTGSFTVDLESSEVYHIDVSLKEIPDNLNLNFSDRKVLKIFATLVARIPNNVSLSAIINKLPINEIGTLIFFFQSLFQIGLAMDLNSRSKTSQSNNPKSASVQKVNQPQSLKASNYKKRTSFVPSFSDHASLSSSSSASSSVLLNSFDENSKNNSGNYFNIQSPIQIQNQNAINRTHSYTPSRPRSKHYGRTIQDLNDMCTPLTKEQLSMLEEMNREFPSLGKYTRIDSFLNILVQFKSLNLRERDGPDIAIRHLQLQNRLSLLIRAGLDEWQRLYSPNESTKFILNASVLSEAKKNSAPSISCLELEVEAMADSICSLTMRNHLRYSAKLIGVSWVGAVIANSYIKHHRNNNNSSTFSFSGNVSTDSENSPMVSKIKTMQRRKTLTGSATIFSSNRSLRGKRNSAASLSFSMATKRIQLGGMNSSLNFFKKLKSINSKEVKSSASALEKSFDPQQLFKNIKNREELELEYWLSRLSPKLKELNGSRFGSESEASNYGTNGVSLSRLTESQWSRAESNCDSDGISPEF